MELDMKNVLSRGNRTEKKPEALVSRAEAGGWTEAGLRVWTLF